jgi:signal transduction histidine kinase
MLNLSDWPVSRRLFTVIVAALLMGLIFGGLRVSDAESSASQFGRVSQLATLGQRLTVLVNALQNERDATLTNLVASNAAPLQPLYANTVSAVQAVRQSTAGIGGGFPANIQADVTVVNADIADSRINDLHNLLSPAVPQSELGVIATYGAIINNMITLQNQVAQGVSDASLTSDVAALNALALAKEQVSQQRALLNYFFTSSGNTDVLVDAPTVQALQIDSQVEVSDEAAFQAAATAAERASFNDSFGSGAASTDIAYAQELIANVIGNQTTTAGGVSGSPLLASVTSPQGGLSILPNMTKSGKVLYPGVTFTSLNQGRQVWDKGMGDLLNGMHSTQTLIADNIANRVSSLKSGAQQSALLAAVITIIVLLVVLAAALLVARSLVLPLRRLRADALNIASVQLPERVKMLSDSPESAAALEVAPINVVSEDEIGQVARAFDQVHSEAVRLAGEQALLRSSFNAMFVNLSRRSQSLIERLARTIDTLEQSEDDPDRLGNLFSMDHMVTRMRRNSENLLLLAGHENPRKWSDSIPLADVARAATSEIEQYNRVTLNVPPGISVIGQAVSDVVHLIAELVENATIFSPKDTQVLLSMQELTSGGVLIEILDKGIGVSDARLADMNFRLDNPPTIDVSVSRHMGLFAVARLAERHRVRVRLRPAAPQGLSALVWLPDSVIERTGRYNSVQSWSTQPTGSQAIVGARQQAVQEMALDEGGATLTQNGYGGNELGGNGYGGNGLGGNGYGGNGYGANSGTALPGREPNSGSAMPGREPNGGTALPGRETRTASGWFRGQVAGAPAPGGGPIGGGTPTGGLGAAPDWSVRRVPGESLGGSSISEQTSAGLPVRSPRTSQTPGGTGSQTPAAGATGGQSTQNTQGSQALPTRGSSDASRSAPSRGPVPRGPGGGNHALPQRSPDLARSRLAAFQRGTRRAEEQPGQSDQSGQFGQASGAGEGSER